MQPAKVLCIHDLSGVGRCSLSVILPVLAACGVQGCALPTALFSTHTGGFGIPARENTFGFSCACLEHYQALHFNFDCIYNGYLAAPECACLAALAYRENPQALKVTDPVLGDHGTAYSFVTSELVQAMRTLCQKSDYITPNVTESALLLGEPLSHQPLSVQAALTRMHSLQTAFGTSVVLTGIALENGKYANGLLLLGQRPELYFYDAFAAQYPGTGDLFASAFIGGLMGGISAAESLCNAAQFVSHAVHYTQEAKTDSRFGVCYESSLSLLIQKRGGRLF